MPSRFESAGGGGARGLRSSKQRGLEKRQLEQEELEAGANRLAEAVSNSETQTTESAKMILTEITKAATGGATPEQLEPFSQAYMAILDKHGALLEEINASGEAAGIDMTGFTGAQDFKERFIPLLEATLQSAPFVSQEVETISVEELSELERVSGAKLPEGALVQRSPDGEVSLAFDPTENPSTIEERRRTLLASGLDRPMGELSAEEIANGIAGGRFSFGVNPITKEMFLKDLAGQEIARAPIEPTTEETPIIPTDIATGSATGVKGIVTNVANTLRDAFGLGLQDPEAQDATDALITIQTLTSLHLLQEISGRDTDGLRKRLDRLTVTANSFFQGEERSKNRLEDTEQMLRGELDRMENQLKTEIDPATRIKLQNNIPQIERLRDAYENLIKGFDIEEEEVDPEIEALLDKHAPLETEKED